MLRAWPRSSSRPRRASPSIEQQDSERRRSSAAETGSRLRRASRRGSRNALRPHRSTWSADLTRVAPRFARCRRNRSRTIGGVPPFDGLNAQTARAWTIHPWAPSAGAAKARRRRLCRERRDGGLDQRLDQPATRLMSDPGNGSVRETSVAASLHTFAPIGPTGMRQILSTERLVACAFPSRRACEAPGIGRLHRRHGRGRWRADRELQRDRRDPDPTAVAEPSNPHRSTGWRRARPGRRRFSSRPRCRWRSTASTSTTCRSIGRSRTRRRPEGVTVYVFDGGIPRTTPSSPGEFASVTPDSPTIRRICNAHGTAVAGAIGGATLGVAPDAQIVDVKMERARLASRARRSSTEPIG